MSALNRRPRAGQSLLLFSLTLLLLTLMVLVTLGIGSRIKSRMELQIATDAAAYSQGVAAARAFNTAALLNRAEVATMVAMAGVQSLISWSGQQRGSLISLSTALAQAAVQCPADAAAIAVLIAKITGTQGAVGAQFQKLDDEAGTQARTLQGAAGALGGEARDSFEDELKGKLVVGQKLINAYVNRSNPDLSATAAGDSRNLRELGGNKAGVACLYEPCGGGAVRNPNTLNKHMIWATMGSRGWTFTTLRSGTGLGSSLGLGGGVSISIAGGGGGSGFGGGGVGKFGEGAEDSQIEDKVSGLEAWAEDHGGALVVTINCTGGPVTVTAPVANAFVRSTDLQNTQGRFDQHYYQTGADDEPPIERHTMGACTRCPGIWPTFLDYNQNEVDNGANDFGQPKLVAMVERDLLAAPADPWSLFFRFRFNKAGPGSVFDNGSKDGKMKTNPLLAKQLAVSSAIVYYHRPAGGGWREPANFLNPFWRATLAPPDMEVNRPDGNLQEAMQIAGYGAHVQVMDGLRQQGFRGFQ